MITAGQNITFDNKFNRLLIFLPESAHMIIGELDPDGALKSNNFRTIDAQRFGISESRGMTVDPNSGELYFLDIAQSQVVRVQPAADGHFDNASISRLDLNIDQRTSLSGLAFDAENGHYHVINPTDEVLYEFNDEGDLVALRDISAFNLANPQSLIFAPSGDKTDDPSIMNLYILDAPIGLPSGKYSNQVFREIEEGLIGQDGERQSGQIVEFSFSPPTPLVATVPTDTVVHENTVLTSAYNPASPDPSGLAYLPNTERLLMSDGEVEEMAIFAGVSAWETTLSGGVTDTHNLSTLAPLPLNITNEPTGVAWNPMPGKGNFFFSDDTLTRSVYEVFPGGDGQYFTNDDVVSTYNTSAIGSDDPEGIAFDSSRGNGHLFVVDGVDAEVYDIDLGSNGHLDASDSVSNFDVKSIGIRDPEGIEFNPHNNHLFILASSGNIIAETTLDGTLLRYLDIGIPMPSSVPRRPAGLAYAPASNGSGGWNLYILDRAIDNDNDPDENDGKMYEVSFSSDNSVPQVYAGPDQTINYPNSAQLNGDVQDDGNPVPPGTVVTLWSMVSVDPPGGTVTFGDASAIDTTATFSEIGLYTLMLDADDGQYVGTDMVEINVILVENQPPSVDAGVNQSITLPDTASLDGTVEDDGLPFPPNLITTWSKVSGPGFVNFADPNAVDTTASFSSPGVYSLLLEADDGEHLVFDSINITVSPGSVQNTWLPILLSVGIPR
jgi:uncharacterized protein YjiK